MPLFEKLPSLTGKIVYHLSHTDLDGYAPEILTRLSNTTKGRFEMRDFVHANYHNFDRELEKVIAEIEEDVEEEEQETYDDYAIVITDISPNEVSTWEYLHEMYLRGVSVIVLDHHITKKDIAAPYEWAIIEDTFNDRLTAATELYYEYLVDKKHLEANKMVASFVELVRSYDTWDWDHTDNLLAKDLNTYFYLINPSDFVKTIHSALSGSTNAEEFAFNEGQQLLVDVENKREKNYIRKAMSKMMEKNLTYLVNGESLTGKVGFMFAENYISQLGNEASKANEHLDFIVMINMSGRSVSLRTIREDKNVGEIAHENWGGGGHSKAAGFTFDESTGIDLLLGRIFENKTNN